jgi:transposase-like protein
MYPLRIWKDQWIAWTPCALAHVPPQQRPAVIALLKTIFAQESAKAAHEQWAAVADGLRERFPKLAELMDSAREDVLAYTAFPREHWPQIASTNHLSDSTARSSGARMWWASSPMSRPSCGSWARSCWSRTTSGR